MKSLIERLVGVDARLDELISERNKLYGALVNIAHLRTRSRMSGTELTDEQLLVKIREITFEALGWEL